MERSRGLSERFCSQAIVIPGLPEMGSSDQPGLEDVALREPKEVTPIPPAL